MADTARLAYNSGGSTVDLQVLSVKGAAEPDHLTKFPGLIHQMLDGSLSSQNAGSRRNIEIKFQVMTDANLRKAVDWWAADDAQIICLATAPGKPSGASSGGGTLDGTYKYKVATFDTVGQSAVGTVSDAIVCTGSVGCALTWTAATSALRGYKLFRSISPYATWDLVDYPLTNSYLDTGLTARAAVTPPASASTINVVVDGDFILEWMYDTELARMLTVHVREASIFLKASGFPI
jgi:hypothetical protein